MPAQPPLPTADQVIGALDRTGFLFEQRVAGILGERTDTGWAFQDQDTGTSREIDIYSTGFAFWSTEGDTNLRWAVLGECKNYQWPWVALTKPWERETRFLDAPELMFTAATRIELKADEDYFLSSGSKPNFARRYERVRFRNQARAVQLAKLNKKSGGWETNSSDIFNEVTYPLAKAVSFLGEEFKRREKDIDFRRVRREVYLLFPAIFLSSPIYAVSASEAEPQVEQVQHVTLERRLSSKSVTGRFRYDVVHVDGIKDWYNNHVLRVVRFFAEELQLPWERVMGRGTKELV
ncbi:hypothetical protein ACGFIG_10625 [Micromonospora sp. NPDC049048]|uniref:hypothetical protein n=1 Tax=Micromonospora sp. NPDC049048 TaxID=3364263 RepID=UPI0037153340